MADRNALLSQLRSLSSAQFEEVLFRLNIEPWVIPGCFAEQGIRATAVMRRLEQEDEGLNRLGGTLANPSIETIGKQYEGYETEAEVRKVVSEYVQQPLAGRSQEQAQINGFLSNHSSGTLLITAPAGYGKSSLLMHWQESNQADCFIAFHCFRTASSVLRSVPNAYRHLLRQLYVYYNRRDRQFPSDLRSQLRGLVDDAKAQPDKKLVIVLDGLDEAQETFEPFLSLPLPDGVYVIASARAEQDDEPEYLKGWTDNAQRQLLKRLPREAIADWVAKIDTLAPYAQNHNFIEKLDTVTVGFPLYLRYLLEDLKQAVGEGKDVEALLTNSPTGFAAYVEKQFGQLTKEVKQEKAVRKLFVLLSVALGALSKDDIEALTELGVWDLPNLPWQVTRWFSIRLDFYSFAHPLLADQFQVALGKKLTESARVELINYCANWQENQSLYALRYYAEHLQEAKQREPLYELARNEAFAHAQQQGIPDEPELPLKPIKLALQSKAEADEAGGMAEFLLLHARRTIDITQESPLDALRAGSLKRAWNLAGHSNREDCVLWHLLLAWALVTENTPEPDRLKFARETLERLQSMQLLRLSDWKAEYAVYLLGQVLPVLQQDYSSLIRQVLENKKLKDLSEELKETAIAQRNAGDAAAAQVTLNTALTTAQQIESSFSKARALKEIAIALVKAGDPAVALTALNTALTTAHQIEDLARKVVVLKEIAIARVKAGDPAAALTALNTALTTAHQIEDSFSKAEALKEIAIALVKAGDLAAAFTTFQQIAYSDRKVDVLKEIAIALVRAGDLAEALITLNTALTTAQQIEDLFYKAHALKKIAIAQMNAGDVAAAQVTLNTALTTAQQIESSSSKAEALQGIAIAQMNAGDAAAAQVTLNTALTTAQQIESSSYKADVLKEIAIAQLNAGEAAAALTTAQQIEDSSSKARALKEIAIAQMNMGDVAAALTTAQQIEDSYYKAEALKEIAIAQMNMGDVAAALTTAQQIEDEDSSYKARALKEIAIAQMNMGESAAALTTAQQIKSSYDKADALKEIAIAQLNAGDAAAAQVTLNTALTTAQQIENSSYKADVLKEIAIAQVNAGDAAAAQVTLNTALTTAQQIEDYSYEGNKALALKEIAIAQLNAGEAAAALTTAQQIKDSSSKARALKEIAIAQMNAGDAAAAQVTLNTALTTAQQIENSSYKADVLKEIAIAQMNAGDAAAAQVTLNTALTTAQQIENSSYKADVLKEIAIAQLNAGEAAAALTTAQQIEDSSSKARALKEIAIAQAKATLGEQAVATAEKILTDRNQHLPEIAAAFVEIGDREHFKRLLVPCADYLDAAYAMCSYLAQLYPNQATAVAKVVSAFPPGSV